MAKPFITYDQQVQKLKTEKNLVIPDEISAKRTLQNIGYYALIGGYKHPFIDPRTRRYINNASFDDIVALYYFDEELRNLFFKYIFRFERKMRSMISYAFTEIHGERQSEYLSQTNYDLSAHNTRDIQKLIGILYYHAHRDIEHEYIVYQRNKYHDIPLWVVINTLTFGQLSKMFSFLPQNMQARICKEFGSLQKNEMIRFMKILTLYRNLCAHGERLFSYRTQIAVFDTALHQRLNIPKKGRTYTYGKNDLFSVVIMLDYLLPRNEFIEFKRRLLSLLNHFEKKEVLSQKALLEYMGFPNNWKDITKYKI